MTSRARNTNQDDTTQASTEPAAEQQPPAPAGTTVRVACDWLHSEFHVGGHVITPAGVDVPADDVTTLIAAAEASGVSLTVTTPQEN